MLGGLVVAGAVALGIGLAAQPGPLSVPTDPRIHEDRNGDYGTVRGTLRASREGRRACFWVEPARSEPLPSKIRTSRYYLLLPGDWSADDSLQLLQSFRRPVARPGDAVTFVGAPGEPGRLPGCPAGVPFGAVSGTAG
jgi:hypothetical protein